MPSMDGNLYAELGLSTKATEVEIRRAYRNLATKAHPDKGGDPVKFKRLQTAYEVLSDPNKRTKYDETGKIHKTVQEDFMDAFKGGSFRDRLVQQELERVNISEQLTVHQSPDFQSHTAGFEAWMRARGDGGAQVYNADTMIEKFGVVKGSYDSVPLPRVNAYTVFCKGLGKAQEVLAVTAEPIPADLEWGEVLVNIRAAPINPADLYTIAMGGSYGSAHVKPPFIPGHDGVGVIVKVGAGVKSLSENDWIIPFKTHLGSWRSLAVWKEKDVFKVPIDLMPLEYVAMSRELCLAYRLLEDHGNLKPGDCVIFNAANSTVGQLLIQLCALLRLRSVAVVREHEDQNFSKVEEWLKGLGADVVISDNKNIKEELDKLKFFAKPKLGLDAVGGTSTVRIADALTEGALLVIYGCITGKTPTWHWQSWVFREMQVKGFSLRRWMNKNKKKIAPMLETLSKLVNADKLCITYTEYELATEFAEALDHAHDGAKNTKILLKVSDIGVEY